MRKIFSRTLLAGILVMGFISCKKSTDDTVTVDISTQNEYDKQAITEFLNANYVDANGKIKAFSSTDPSDDAFPKLSSMSPVTLPSGVVYIKFLGKQPIPGTTIGETDILRIMEDVTSYTAQKNADLVSFQNKSIFQSSLTSTGVPVVDPIYYYAPPSLMASLNKPKSFFEMEGFQEAIRQFKAFTLSDDQPYTLQGIIIVPSSAAYARDENYYNAQNRSFVFNFQVYKTTPR